MRQLTIFKIGVALLCTVPLLSQGQIVEQKEYAAEVMETNLGDAPIRGGLVYVKRCDQCVTEGVSFSSETQYFQRKAQITAAHAMELDGKGATIFFDPKSRYVTRVIFWTKPGESE